MPRRAVTSLGLTARVRAWFGLNQAELALYLAVSPTLIHAIEADRRTLTIDVLHALLPLMQHLPPASPVTPDTDMTPATLPPGTPAPDAAELDFRRRVCLQQIARLSQKMTQLEQQARVAQRWTQALPALLQAAETIDPVDPEAADHAAWRAGWLRRRTRPLPVADVTRWHLLRARVAALTVEAAALAEAAPPSSG